MELNKKDWKASILFLFSSHDPSAMRGDAGLQTLQVPTMFLENIGETWVTWPSPPSGPLISQKVVHPTIRNYLLLRQGAYSFGPCSFSVCKVSTVIYEINKLFAF